MPSASLPDDDALAFAAIKSPLQDDDERVAAIPVKPTLYMSAVLAFVQVMSFGWSQMQLNYSGFHDVDDCKARPVKPHTCVVYPGHTPLDWTFLINAWVVGGMIAALVGGRLAEAFGRKRMLYVDAVIMIVGAALQSLAPTMTVFILGRFVVGLASGLGTAIPNGYVSEISPPHLRSKLGALYQIAVATGGTICVGFLFIVGTSSHWKTMAAFPAIFALIFLIFAPWCMVESPTWLISCGRRDEAERELARLFGEENVSTALLWVLENRKSTHETDSNVSVSSVGDGDGYTARPTASWTGLFASSCRLQTFVGLTLAMSMVLCGMAAVMVYSSIIFKSAGMTDGRVGSLIINLVTMFPPFTSGMVVSRFGNRKTLLGGMVVMWWCVLLLTVALITTCGPLAIVMSTIHVITYALTVGPLSFITAANLFPDSLRAQGSSLCVFAYWFVELCVLIGYPYLAAALGHYGLTPFLFIIVVLVWFEAHYLPDTTGKTSAEVQAMFRESEESKDEEQSGSAFEQMP